MVQGADVSAGDTYEARWSDSSTTTFDEATFLEIIEIGTRPTVTIRKNNYVFDFGKPVANVEWVRFAGELTNNSDVFTLSISDDGSSWTDLMTTGSINGPNDNIHPPIVSTTPARYYKVSRTDYMQFDRYGFSDNVLNKQVHVISTGYPDSNTMTVDGGDWGGEGTISYNSANGSNAIDPNNIFDGNENTFGTFTVDGSFIGFDSTGNNLRVKFILDKLHPDHKIYVQPKVNGGWTNSGTFDYNGLNYIDFDGVAAGTEIDTVFTMPDGYDGEARLSATGGNTLKDSTRISIYSSYSAGDTHVEYQTNGGQGDIVSVNTDDNTILLSNTGDRDNRWIIGAVDTAGDAGNSGETGDAANAKNHYVAPASAPPITQDHAWCNLQIVNDKAQVTGIQKEEPQFTAVTAVDYSIKFPSVFGTGNAPDTDLPDGTAISVEVKAENEHGSSEKESNTLTASVTRATETSQLDSNDPADVAKQQAIAAAFDAFPVNVNNRRTSIASSLYRLYEGENVSADEFQLLEEVVSNAINVVEPFALDGYYPLYYTAAKANAASSEGTHHTHTINGITYYMPDGGTIYHGNYI